MEIFFKKTFSHHALLMKNVVKLLKTNAQKKTSRRQSSLREFIARIQGQTTKNELPSRIYCDTQFPELLEH
jgi:hypothetical protein